MKMDVRAEEMNSAMAKASNEALMGIWRWQRMGGSLAAEWRTSRRAASAGVSSGIIDGNAALHAQA